MKFFVKDSNKIDLHIHSIISDGSWNVKKIVSEAIDLGLEYIAITDHDTDEVDCYIDRKRIKKEYNLKIIIGTELTVKYEGKILHLLAYDYNCALARLVMNQMDKHYYSKGLISLKKACHLMHMCGAKVILAHPFKYRIDGKELVDSIVKQRCIDGIECIHSYHTQEEIDFLLDVCDKNNLYVTAGSDFHRKERIIRNNDVQNTLAELPVIGSTIEEQLKRAKQKYNNIKR